VQVVDEEVGRGSVASVTVIVAARASGDPSATAIARLSALRRGELLFQRTA
jgi:hypothetical protein